jgi:hypothetical protein
MNNKNEDWFGQAFEEPCTPIEEKGKFFCRYVPGLEVKIKEAKNRSEQEIKS